MAQWIAHWTSRGLKGFKGSGFESRRSRICSFIFLPLSVWLRPFPLPRPFPHGRGNRADQPGASRRPPPVSESLRGTAEPNTDGASGPPPASGCDRALRRAGHQRPPVAACPCLMRGVIFKKNVWKERSQANPDNSNDLGTYI